MSGRNFEEVDELPELKKWTSVLVCVSRDVGVCVGRDVTQRVGVWRRGAAVSVLRQQPVCESVYHW